ncbi:hypothetical protein BV25DRAFT_1869007 [Artomyces pyxidatus]|uniref:Uncharacterized protein n=1 Tax=Artomyces pyxidatus TaxID=48021 RepID=A0ACB8T8T1_9AGAM|nr:hypothetical protein BV25DRAFT_1869007 [Artomyces pyxidatus]
MKFSSGIASLALLATAVKGSPLRRADPPTDIDILNFALTLEHLENAFYAQGLSKFSAQDFANAGLPDWTYGRIQQVAAHEATHVKFLESALGPQAVQACDYSFPYTDPKSFLVVSHALESVGDSAYMGAAKFIQNKDYLLAAATILSVEARHSAWLESAVRKGSAWNTAFDTPLDLNQVYTLASAFITACPSTNPKLPVTAYPALTVDSASPGQTATLHFSAPDGFDKSLKLYGAFLNGQNAYVVPLGDNWTVTVPPGLLGTTYLVVTTDADGVSDDKTIAGPAMLDFPFNSAGDQEVLWF